MSVSEAATNDLITSNDNDDDDDAKAYNKFFSSSVVFKNGFIRNGLLTLSRFARDVDNNKKRSFLYHIRTESTSDGSHFLPPIEEPSSIKARVPSPSGEKVAVFVKETNSGESKQVIEIWTNAGTTLQRRINLPLGTLHGDICFDTSWFGGISWRPHDEDVIVYVAEKISPSTNSFFHSDKDVSENQSKTESKTGGQFTLGVGKKEDWGEKFVGTADLRLFCVSIKTGKVSSVQNTPASDDERETNSYTLGQPVFSPCGTNIVYTAWDAGAGGKMPRKLGSIYCYQRSCFLYSSSVQNLIKQLNSEDDNNNTKDNEKNLDKACLCLTPNDALARSPRFPHLMSESTTNTKLAFLCSPEGFATHGGCMALHTFDWDCEKGHVILSTREALVDEIKLPSFSESKSESETHSDTNTLLDLSFPGIFTNDLPQECFSPDGSFLFLTSIWGSISRVLQISTITGDVHAIPFNLNEDSSSPTHYCSQSIICTSNDGIVVTQTSPNQPAKVGFLLASKVFSSLVPQSKQEAQLCIPSRLLCNISPIACTSFSELPSFPQIIDDIHDSFTWEMVATAASTNVKDDNLPPVQSILLLPKNKQKPPLIVVPHGGPHSCSTTSYMPSYAYLCGHGGYAILLVNYHGSAGFGQDSLEALAGKVGVLDVEDVWEATKQIIGTGKVHPDRVGICGGSHGGFLTGHMIGKYPDLYKVAAMRNPVTNIATMVTATDIPDWTYVECLGVKSYDFSKFRGPSREELGIMWDASPIATIENIKAPTLIALGMMDRRVPPSQGLEFYHALRSRQIKTKLLVYDKDVHAIDIPVSEADHWINIKQWFDKHL